MGSIYIGGDLSNHTVNAYGTTVHTQRHPRHIGTYKLNLKIVRERINLQAHKTNILIGLPKQHMKKELINTE